MPKKPESEKRNSLFLRAMHRTFLHIQGEKSGAVKKASFLTAPKFRLMTAPGRYFISDEEKCSRLHGSVRRIGLGLRICRVQLDIKPGDKLHQSYKVCYADHSVAVYVGHMCDDIVAGDILHQPVLTLPSPLISPASSPPGRSLTIPSPKHCAPPRDAPK